VRKNRKEYFAYLELQRTGLRIILDSIGQILLGKGVQFFWRMAIGDYELRGVGGGPSWIFYGN
jgi:hypothetical protein